MSNIHKALDLIGTFATGNAELAASLLDEGYIQHNLAYGSGRDAFVGSVEYLASAPAETTVRNIRAFEDGDKVFLQTVYNFAGAGEQVAFDIFRFNEEGLIAEHWDNLTAVAGPNPSGRTQIDGPTEASDLDRAEENRTLVEAFLMDVMQGKHPEKTPEYFAGDAYLQHNTGIADGLSNEPRQRSLDARASSAALARGVGGSAVAGSDWKPTLSISSGMRRHSKNA